MAKTMTTAEFIAKARGLLGDKYDYTETIYTGSKNKIKLTCDNGHKYEQQAGNHLRGSACYKCAKKNSKKMRLGWFSGRH